MSIKPSGKEPVKYQHIEPPKFYGEMAKIEKPMFEMPELRKIFIENVPHGEILNREQQVRQEKAFNKAFESLMSRLSDEDKAAFKADPVGFLNAHPEYTKPSIEATEEPKEAPKTEEE